MYKINIMDEISLDIEDYSLDEMMDILSINNNSTKESIIIQKSNLFSKASVSVK